MAFYALNEIHFAREVPVQKPNHFSDNGTASESCKNIRADDACKQPPQPFIKKHKAAPDQEKYN